jgi:hypothetical protein
MSRSESHSDGNATPRNGREMSTHHNREPRRRVHAPGREVARRRADSPWRRWTRLGLLLALAALVPAALLAPVGLAQGSGASSPEAAAGSMSAKEIRRTEREERVAAERAEREAQRSAARGQRQAQRQATSEETGERPVQNSSREREHGDVYFSCTQVTWKYKAFPDVTVPKNKVTQLLTLKDAEEPRISSTFEFEGTTGEDVTPFVVPPGSYKIDGYAHWNTNGLRGGMDVLGSLNCPVAPAFSVEKLQRIAAGNGSYQTAPIVGEVGDTVDYEIVVKNTGNVPLTLSDFTDPNCGAVTGGPGSTPLAVGASTTYECSRVLEGTGPFTNEAEVSGIPPGGDGGPITNTSNTVLAEVPPPPPAEPAITVEKLQQLGSGGYTTSQVSGTVGETVHYEIVVKNTGNVPVTIGSFSDPQCDQGTLTGGTGGPALPAGASTTYTCTHLLDAADGSAGSYTNVVTVSATPPSEGTTITHSSNTVVATVAPASSSGNAPTTGSSGSSGVLSSTFTQPSKSGVLAFSSQTVPALKGPQGCVRHSFEVSIKSAGVASVTFYLDAHKLKTLTAKNARKGLLTISINPDKLKIGVHKLTAKITMTHSASTKAKQASRTVQILRCHAAAVTPKFTG